MMLGVACFLFEEDARSLRKSCVPVRVADVGVGFVVVR
jgi:hypothetical protein